MADDSVTGDSVAGHAGAGHAGAGHAGAGHGVPVRCPAISDPECGLAAPGDFDGILARLGSSEPVTEAQEFARGLMRPDGRVDLCKQGLGPVQVARVVRAAVGSPHAVHLLLGTNGLGAEGAKAVADALTPGHRIRTIYLGCNRIDAGGVSALAERLAVDDSVKALWLKRNPIGDDGVDRLCAALVGNTSLRTLDLVNTGLTTRGLEGLAEALSARTPGMERVFLGGNGLREDAVPALARMVRDGGVRELYLAVNQLGDDGSAALAEAVAGYPMTLGLGGNGIRDVSGLTRNMRAWVALDLARPPSERALGGQSNVVGDDGAALFAAALPGSALRRLDLRFTGITGRGARLLIENDHDLDYLGINGGVPRRMRRLAAKSTNAPHEDIQAIASVYR